MIVFNKITQEKGIEKIGEFPVKEVRGRAREQLEKRVKAYSSKNWKNLYDIQIEVSGKEIFNSHTAAGDQQLIAEFKILDGASRKMNLYEGKNEVQYNKMRDIIKMVSDNFEDILADLV